ncbi:MAG: hypothetical protein Q8L29_00755 [archaeon]|nr:hypothetical protein [archaeon]
MYDLETGELSTKKFSSLENILVTVGVIFLSGTIILGGYAYYTVKGALERNNFSLKKDALERNNCSPKKIEVNQGSYSNEPAADGYWMQGFKLKERSDGARNSFRQVMDALGRRY